MFYFTDDTKLLVTKTLKEFDQLLSDHDFIRVHQSHLINVKFIKGFTKSDGYIFLKDGIKIPVSTRKKQVLMDMIQKF
jgi:two-component system LytT family response regulator